MSSLAFLVTELQVRVRHYPLLPVYSSGCSLYPARRNEGTRKLERCLWSCPAHRFTLISWQGCREVIGHPQGIPGTGYHKPCIWYAPYTSTPYVP
jgi:hypothetical protein